MTLAQHKLLPLSSFQHATETGQLKPYMKHRKVEICFHSSCVYKQNHYHDLTRHLRVQHGIYRKQYLEHRYVYMLLLDPRQSRKGSYEFSSVRVSVRASVRNAVFSELTH